MTMVNIRGNPIEGRPIDWDGIILQLPSDETAIKEGRVYVLGLAPEVYFNPEHFPNEKRRIEVWEIKTNEPEKVFADEEFWGLFRGYYVWRTLKELYRHGARSFDEFREGAESFLKDPEWFEVWEAFRELRNNPEWWKKAKEDLEKLKVMEKDTLTANGKEIGTLYFLGTIEGDYVKLMGDGKTEPGDIPYLIYKFTQRFEEEIGVEGVEYIRGINETDKKLELTLN